MSFVPYTPDQLAKYFARLDYTGDASVNLETLRELQWRHVSHINYENLDILAGIPLSLEPQELYHKFMERGAGGFCFEMNGVMSHVLKSLGFKVHNYAARVCRAGTLYVERARFHRALAVELDGKAYLVDVGLMGEAPRCPILMQDGLEQFDGLNEYRLVRDDFYYWLLQARLKGAEEWTPVYGFTLEEQFDADFIPNSYYCEMHPSSNFRGRVRLSIMKPGCCIMINGNELRVQRGAECDVTALETNADIEKAMLEYFGERMRTTADA